MERKDAFLMTVYILY